MAKAYYRYFIIINYVQHLNELLDVVARNIFSGNLIWLWATSNPLFNTLRQIRRRAISSNNAKKRSNKNCKCLITFNITNWDVARFAEAISMDHEKKTIVDTLMQHLEAIGTIVCNLSEALLKQVFSRDWWWLQGAENVTSSHFRFCRKDDGRIQRATQNT